MRPSTHYLLVEDDQNDAALVSMVFAQAKERHLHIVNDGTEAMAYLLRNDPYTDRRKFPTPQIVMVDLKMPRMNGFEFLRWLREQAPEPLRILPVVVMSSSAEAEDIQRAYRMGANSYMQKPLRWNDFAERIRILRAYWGEHVHTLAVDCEEEPRVRGQAND